RSLQIPLGPQEGFMNKLTSSLLISLAVGLIALYSSAGVRAGPPDECHVQPGAKKTRTFSIPHIIEKQGTIQNTQFTFDTTIFAVYSAGLGGTTCPKEGFATIELYLFDDQTSQPMKANGTQDVCNPCTFTLDAQHRKASIRIDDLITAAGGFGGST